MKLYNLNLSNFATKSRLVIYEKGLNIEMAPIPGGDLNSPEYAKINPLGKTPALDADGLLIPESEVINEYLEDKYPTPALMPKSPEGRAKVRIITRFHDLYLEPPLRALFGQMNPKTRDEKVVGEKVTDLKNRIDQLEKMLADGGFACGIRIHPGGLRARADDVLHHQPGTDVRRQAARRTSETRSMVGSGTVAAGGEEGPRRDGGSAGSDAARRTDNQCSTERGRGASRANAAAHQKASSTTNGANPIRYDA